MAELSITKTEVINALVTINNRLTELITLVEKSERAWDLKYFHFLQMNAGLKTVEMREAESKTMLMNEKGWEQFDDLKIELRTLLTNKEILLTILNKI